MGGLGRGGELKTDIPLPAVLFTLMSPQGRFDCYRLSRKSGITCINVSRRASLSDKPTRHFGYLPDAVMDLASFPSRVRAELQTGHT